MIPISQAMPKQRTFTLRDDEYRNEDGIICCKKCHTPRQASITIEGEVYSSRVICKCQKGQYDREEAEEKARRQRQQIERNRSVGLPDPVLRKHTFENDLGYNPKVMQIARNYCEQFDDFRKDGLGLLLWGDVGTGKSFIAGCIANDLLNKGKRVLMTNFSRLLNRLTDLQMGDRNGYIDSLNANDLLIIDDLGIERNSDFAKEQTFNIIDSRYRSGKPLIVTTNLSLQEMSQTQDLMRRRIFDRVRERCIPVNVSGRNIRKNPFREDDGKRKGAVDLWQRRACGNVLTSTGFACANPLVTCFFPPSRSFGGSAFWQREKACHAPFRCLVFAAKFA